MLILIKPGRDKIQLIVISNIFQSTILPLSIQSPPAFRTLTIRCARVAGIEIPNNKRIETALTYIHGVGKTTARQVLLDLDMENKQTRELSEEDLTALRDEVSKYMTEGDLVSHHAYPL